MKIKNFCDHNKVNMSTNISSNWVIKDNNVSEEEHDDTKVNTDTKEKDNIHVKQETIDIGDLYDYFNDIMGSMLDND